MYIVCLYVFVWERTSRARRGRVIWRRQVIDSPSGDNARPPTSLIVPRDGYRSNSVYFKGDRGRSGLEGPLDDGFSVTRTDPRLSTRTDPVNWYSAVAETPTNAQADAKIWDDDEKSHCMPSTRTRSIALASVMTSEAIR